MRSFVSAVAIALLVLLLGFGLPYSIRSVARSHMTSSFWVYFRRGWLPATMVGLLVPALVRLIDGIAGPRYFAGYAFGAGVALVVAVVGAAIDWRRRLRDADRLTTR